MEGGGPRVPAKGEYPDENVSVIPPPLNLCPLQCPPDPDCRVWIYYQNVRGVRTKIDDLFLASTDCNFDVVVLTETGLDDQIMSAQLFGTSFNVFRCDRSAINSRKSRFGGVLIAVSQQYSSCLITTTNGQNLEQVSVSARMKNRNFVLCATYIPPDRSQDPNILNEHVAAVHELCEKCSIDDTVLVCGDFNQPRMHWTKNEGRIVCDSLQLPLASHTLLDGMDFSGLEQKNLVYNLLGRTLDLVFCPFECEATVDSSSAPLLPVDTHHPPLSISLPACTVNDLHVDDDMHDDRPLNYRLTDFTALSDHLLNIDWISVFDTGDVDDMAERFCSELRTWLDTHVPCVKPPAFPAWSTSQLRALKRKRNLHQRRLRCLRTLENVKNFHRASNAYRSLNASLYKSYVLRVQTNLRRNPRSFWRFVDSKRKSSTIPPNVMLNDSVAASPAESCELFARHFAAIFSSNKTSRQEADIAAANVPAGMIEISTFIVTPEMVVFAAKKLKCSFSPGPDGLPAAILCRCISAAAVPLSKIFSRSFEQAKFPRIWKESYVRPIFKNGDRKNVANYRGITNLSAASKLFEIIVSGVVLDCAKNYIVSDQHGFMPGRSVSTNLLSFTSNCVTSMESKAQMDVIYTDLKAAFDKIDHTILLRKLSRLGFSTQLICWLESYLTERVLRVKLDKYTSSSFTNVSGVPQGSNLGPLLFVLFINDVALLLGLGRKLVYADDLKLYLPVRSIDDCRHLQCLLKVFVDWCDRNKLVVNVAKCNVITFHRKQNPLVFDYNINGVILSRVDTVRDLGVELDTKITFGVHYSTIIAKANRQLGFIFKIGKDFKDPHCMKALYCSLVRPILEYASLVWFPHTVSWSLRIERVQKRFIRLALRNLPWRDPLNLPPYPDRCLLLGLDTLQRRRRIQQALLIAKLINGEIDAPELLAQICFRIPSRALRNTNLLQHRFHRTAFGYNEPISSCIRTFTVVEDLFEFDEPSSRFASRIGRSPLL